MGGKAASKREREAQPGETPEAQARVWPWRLPKWTHSGQMWI